MTVIELKINHCIGKKRSEKNCNYIKTQLTALNSLIFLFLNLYLLLCFYTTEISIHYPRVSTTIPHFPLFYLHHMLSHLPQFTFIRFSFDLPLTRFSSTHISFLFSTISSLQISLTQPWIIKIYPLLIFSINVHHSLTPCYSFQICSST